MRHRHLIAVLSDIDPHGGGSHQWALNILYALDDYRAARGDIDVLVLHYRDYPQGHPLIKLFPAFGFAGVSTIGNLVARILRRLSILAPWGLPLLRPFFPINRIAARRHVKLVLFPVTALDAPLCSRRNVLCMADIAHIYHPNFPEVSENNQLRIREVIFRHGIANAGVIMVESEQLRREIHKHYDADPAKVHVVYQVLPRLFELTAHEDGPRVLPEPYLFYPAQLWAHKNHQNLLTAFATVAREFPALRLVLSGSRKAGDEAIFSQIAELGLSERVLYLGYVPDEHIPHLYRHAAAMVMPTYFGPTNIPTLEAFAFGCPAVISDLPGVEEQSKDAALRFNPDDPADMADKLRQVLTSPALAAQLVAAGRERLKDLSYKNFCAAMFSLYEAAMQAPATGRHQHRVIRNGS